MPVDQTCSTCRHFHPTNTGLQGQCRRYPMPVLKDRGYGCGEWMTRSDPLGDVLAERERAAKVTGPTDIPTVEPAPPASEQLSRHREEIEQAANQHRRKPRR